MLLQPGPNYPVLGGVVDNIRLTAGTIGTHGQAQWAANSRPSARFTFINGLIRAAVNQWNHMTPEEQDAWNQAGAAAAHWPTAQRCGKGFYHGGGTDTPSIVTDAVAHGGSTGYPPPLPGGPLITLQPNRDQVQVLPGGLVPGDPPPLVNRLYAVWTRAAVPPNVPVFLLISARMVYTIPEGEGNWQRDVFGGCVPIVFGVPVCIDEVLLATGRIFRGATIWIQASLLEPGFIPFFYGHVAVDNRSSAPAGPPGWGEDPWGGYGWGD